MPAGCPDPEWVDRLIIVGSPRVILRAGNQEPLFVVLPDESQNLVHAPSTAGVAIEDVQEFLDPKPGAVEVQLVRPNGAPDDASEGRLQMMRVASSRHLLHVGLSLSTVLLFICMHI